MLGVPSWRSSAQLLSGASSEHGHVEGICFSSAQEQERTPEMSDPSDIRKILISKIVPIKSV